MIDLSLALLLLCLPGSQGASAESSQIVPAFAPEPVSLEVATDRVKELGSDPRCRSRGR